MRVALLNGETTYPLAGQSGVAEAVHSSASGLRIRPDTVVQTQRFLRGPAGKARDRLGLVNRITFGTTRVFATPAAAELWAMDLETTVPRAGVLILEPTAAGEGQTRYMADAVVDPPEREVIGCSVLLRYTVSGGEITGSLPGTWDSTLPWEPGANWEDGGIW